MGYSKIKTFRVKNFRNIGDITIDFTESPVVVLTGDNESGKTSIVKALAVLAANDNFRGQKDYIRDGTNGFGIAVDLEDGTTVVRMKTNTINRAEVHKPGEEPWITNKMDDGSEVPYPIAQVMGMVKEPETKELLHTRTYEDPLLFVITNASTNYRVMYNALKVEQLTNAISLGSDEANELRYNINKNDIAIKAFLDNLRKIKIHNTEAISNIKERVKSQLNTLDKLHKALEIKDNIKKIEKKLEQSKQLSKLSDINLDVCRKLRDYSKLRENIIKLSELLTRYEESNKLQEIDINIGVRLYDAIGRKLYVEKYRDELMNYKGISGLRELNVDLCNKLYRASELVNYIEVLNKKLSKFSLQGVSEISDYQIDLVVKSKQLINYVVSIKILEKSLKKLEEERYRLNDIIANSGAVVAECSSCGNSIVVDVRAYL